MKKNFIVALLSPVGILAFFFFISPDVHAAIPEGGLYDANGVLLEWHEKIKPGSSVAIGDADRDGIDEIVVGSPPGIGSKVTVYEFDESQTSIFYPFNGRVFAGVNVAIGDPTGNGNEIIVAAREGGGAHIQRYVSNGVEWSNGKLLSPGFFAYGLGFRGGANVTTGDINGDGKDEIITGPGPGGGAHVKAFTAEGKLVAQILPGNVFPNESYRGGAIVGAIDYDDDGKDEIVVAPQFGRVTDLMVFEPYSRKKIKQIRVFGGFTGGVSMSINSSGGGKRVLLGANAGGGPHVIQYNLKTGLVDGVSIFPFSESWRGGVEVRFWEYEGKVKFFANPGSVNLKADALSRLGQAVSPISAPTVSYVAPEVPVAGIFDSDGRRLSSFPKVKPGSSIATGDVDSDSADEIVVGSPSGVRSQVDIYKKNGTLVKTFYPYSSGMTAGINIAIGDANNDGSMEILTIPRKGAGADLRIFSRSGTLLKQFFAYSSDFHGGAVVAVGDSTGDGINEILVGAVSGKDDISWFNFAGTKLKSSKANRTTGLEEGGIGGISMFDWEGDGKHDLVIAPSINYLHYSLQLFVPSVMGKSDIGNDGRESGPSVCTISGDTFLAFGGLEGFAPVVTFKKVIPDNYFTTPYTFVQPFSDRWLGGVEAGLLNFDGKGTLEVFASPGSRHLTDQRLQYYTHPTIHNVKNSSYERKVFSATSGQVTADVVSVNLANPKLRVRTMYGSPVREEDRRSLRSFVDQVNGFAGINGGTFSCVPNGTECTGPGVTPWFDTFKQRFHSRAGSRASWTFDTNNQLHYNAMRQINKETFFLMNKLPLRAGFSHGPELTFAGRNMLTGDIGRNARSAVGVKDNIMYLVSSSSASVTDMADIMEQLGTEYSMLLDGGGSTALYYDGQYRKGPGRAIANAIVFTEN